MASLQMGSALSCSGDAVLSFRTGLHVMLRVKSADVSVKNPFLEGGGVGEGLWRRRGRREGGSFDVRCAVEETPNSSVLREAGSKRRAARKAEVVIQRVENATEAIERRAMARKATKLYPRSLLESLGERMKQNEWQRALRVCMSSTNLTLNSTICSCVLHWLIALSPSPLATAQSARNGHKSHALVKPKNRKTCSCRIDIFDDN